MYHSFLIHSFADGHLGCFQYLAIVQCAAMTIGVHRFLWIGVSGFLGYNPSSRIAGPKGSSIVSFLRKFHTVFPNLCPRYHLQIYFPIQLVPFSFADVFFSHAEAFYFDEVPFIYSFLYVP